MLSIVLDIRSVEQLDRAIASIKPQLGSMQARSCNLGGDRLYDLVQRFLATRYQMHWAQVDMALDFTPASPTLPVYTLTFSNNNLPYRRWITSRDEKVCKICGPRDGQIFHLFDTYELYPAHPNCRCRLERLDIGNAFAELPPSIMTEPLTIAAEHFLEEFEKAWNAADRMVS